MSGGERVEDTRTLQPGDRVRVVLHGTVEAAEHPETYWRLRSDSGARLFLWQHRDSPGEVHRLPKPLPPEPPVGVEVLGTDSDGDPLIFERWEDRGWANGRVDPIPWGQLLKDYGPVRLLGDPIEAPR